MYKIEDLLFKQLSVLKKLYNVQGIKAEFEAEGSSYRDVNRLGRICSKLDIGLFLKIGIENIKDIASFSSKFINNITIGRSDLTASFFNKNLNQDSNFIFQLIEEVAPIIHENKMSLTIGGGVTYKTIEKIKSSFPNLQDLISKIETRKVIFNTSDLFGENNSSIEHALKFEELYILSKKDFSDMYIDSEISRLTELSRRVKE